MHMSGAFQLHLYWRAIPIYGDSNIFVFIYFFLLSLAAIDELTGRQHFPFSSFIEFSGHTVREWKKKAEEEKKNKKELTFVVVIGERVCPENCDARRIMKSTFCNFFRIYLRKHENSAIDQNQKYLFDIIGSTS